jgi:UDP-3-O-[3-hydroxymyristoyl] glucosamine N-acyltransferase
MRAGEIAELLGGRLEGDPEREISEAGDLRSAQSDQIAFAAGDEASRRAAESAAGCLLIGEDAPALNGRTVIRVPKPRKAFARVLQILHPPERPAPGVHSTAVIAETAVLGEGVSIGPHVTIAGAVRIGAGTVIEAGVSIGRGVTVGTGCWLYPRVVVYHDVEIGDRVILHAGCVLGADGFGYELDASGHEKFPQLGSVRIGNDVEIGANSCVDRAALAMTEIGDGSKLDNMVHVAHNCIIGKHVVIAAQTGLSGGCIIGDNALIGGQVGMGDKVRVEPGAVLGSGCGVLPHKVVPAGEPYWGTPARPLREYLKGLAALGRLPKVLRELRALQARAKDGDAA